MWKVSRGHENGVGRAHCFSIGGIRTGEERDGKGVKKSKTLSGVFPQNNAGATNPMFTEGPAIKLNDEVKVVNWWVTYKQGRSSIKVDKGCKVTMNATASTQFKLYITVGRAWDKRLKFMQSPWERRVRRKNREHRLSGHCMGGDRCVPVINWKTLPFDVEFKWFRKQPWTMGGGARGAIWEGRNADFMNSVGKLRRTDLQKLLTEAQHALAFSLPPILWSYTPREFNKCADFLAGIARDYAKQSLTPELLPYSLSPFSFPLPPSLSSLYSPPIPLTLSPPSSAFTFHESPDFPISSFPQLARKAVHSPPLQRYLRALQKGPSSLTSLSVLYRPTADDQRGRLYPLAVGASKLSRHYRALLFGRSHIEIDITGSHYQFFQRFSLSLSWTFLFPLSTNLGHFFLLILLLRTRTSLNNTLLLPRTCPRSCSTPPSNPPCSITGAKDTGPLIRYGPFSIKSLRPNPASCSSQSIIRTPYIVLPYLCEPFLSYHGTSRNPLAQIFHLLHIVTSLDL